MEDIVITMSTNYYKDLWTKEDSHGQKFWNKVDFDDPKYKYQEDVFRTYLKDYVRCEKDINTVLELGVGTGRMTKIVQEIFPNIKYYYGLDINPESIRTARQHIDFHPIYVDLVTFMKTYNNFTPVDMIIASEVFMHIKPEDIEYVIEGCSERLNKGGHIINIDWSFEYEKSEWCFIHDYDKLYTKYGLRMVGYNFMLGNKQTLTHYVK